MSDIAGLKPFPVEPVLEAFRAHDPARKSLRRLAHEGCEIGPIYVVLHFYSQIQDEDLGSPVDFTAISAKAKALRASCNALARQFTESREVPLLKEFVTRLERSTVPITALLGEWAAAIDLFEAQNAPLRDRRSAPSPRILLAIAHAEIHRCTQKDHYRDIANLVEAAFLAGGTERDVSDDAIRKLCDRSDSGNPILKLVVDNFGESLRQALNGPEFKACYNPLKDGLLKLCEEEG
ncbi:MAG: hypothetical protein M3O85_01095 [Acidobacteriota bacterium]|nr:hypothetical protein [Acidobacteriota bacterium]